MAFPYNTRSATAASAATATTATTTDVSSQPRHFCIALTNNPRMLRKAQQELAIVLGTSIPTEQGQPATRLSPPQTRQRTASENYQLRTRSEQQVVPGSTESMGSIEPRTCERDLEEDFKIQIQPILQNYLNKTKRSPPINLFLDMSSFIKY